uniref:Uncharacterized protein n=1 Tax=Arundo donax TaxID=35708 RepID=A0A0A9F1S3_ARUDO
MQKHIEHIVCSSPKRLKKFHICISQQRKDSLGALQVPQICTPSRARGNVNLKCSPLKRLIFN